MSIDFSSLTPEGLAKAWEEILERNYPHIVNPVQNDAPTAQTEDIELAAPQYTVAADYPENEDLSELHYLERAWRRRGCAKCGDRRATPVMMVQDGELRPVKGCCVLCWDPAARNSSESPNGSADVEADW